MTEIGGFSPHPCGSVAMVRKHPHYSWTVTGMCYPYALEIKTLGIYKRGCGSGGWVLRARFWPICILHSRHWKSITCSFNWGSKNTCRRVIYSLLRWEIFTVQFITILMKPVPIAIKWKWKMHYANIIIEWLIAFFFFSLPLSLQIFRICTIWLQYSYICWNGWMDSNSTHWRHMWNGRHSTSTAGICTLESF